MSDCFDRFSSEDGRMDGKQFRAYLDHANEHSKAQGLKGREHTDEYHDMVWECCKRYRPENERRTKSELSFIFRYVCPEKHPMDRFEALRARGER